VERGNEKDREKLHLLNKGKGGKMGPFSGRKGGEKKGKLPHGGEKKIHNPKKKANPHLHMRKIFQRKICCRGRSGAAPGTGWAY